MTATSRDSAIAAMPGVLRIASVPANHVYVRHITSPGDGVMHLADPVPEVSRPVPGQWWPPAMLDPVWVRSHAGDFDVFHVHFGFDAIDPRQLSAVVDALRVAGRPLVYTVHDLRNPHHEERGAHEAHLDVLVPAADALVTLTRGAAREIESRWQRHAYVIAHPHVVELERMTPRSAWTDKDGRFTVGLHLKSVRANMAPAATVQALAPLTSELAGLRLLIDVHRDVAELDGARHDPELMAVLRDASRSTAVDVHVHDCYSDAELWDYFERIDLSVLPYRFGTHSGWLEACHDLGTTVLAPDCGYFAEQRPCLIYHADDDGPDAASLSSGVRRAWALRPRWQASPQARASEREAIARQYRSVYEAVLDR